MALSTKTQIRLNDALTSVKYGTEFASVIASAKSYAALVAANTTAQANKTAADAAHTATPGDSGLAAAATAADAAAVTAAANLAAATTPAFSAQCQKRVIEMATSVKFGNEILAAGVSGANLSKEACRRILISLTSAHAGNELINAIQTTPLATPIQL